MSGSWGKWLNSSLISSNVTAGPVMMSVCRWIMRPSSPAGGSSSKSHVLWIEIDMMIGGGCWNRCFGTASPADWRTLKMMCCKLPAPMSRRISIPTRGVRKTSWATSGGRFSGAGRTYCASLGVKCRTALSGMRAGNLSTTLMPLIPKTTNGGPRILSGSVLGGNWSR
jgi:hypothetical protein